MPPAEVHIEAAGGGYFRAACSVHGPLPVLWVGDFAATLDAMGHATAHHALPSTLT